MCDSRKSSLGSNGYWRARAWTSVSLAPKFLQVIFAAFPAPEDRRQLSRVEKSQNLGKKYLQLLMMRQLEPKKTQSTMTRSSRKDLRVPCQVRWTCIRKFRSCRLGWCSQFRLRRPGRRRNKTVLQQIQKSRSPPFDHALNLSSQSIPYQDGQWWLQLKSLSSKYDDPLYL